MNRPNIEENMLTSLKSSFTFQSSLLHYLDRLSLLLKGRMKIGHDESVGRTIFSTLKHVNELQRLIYLRLVIYADYFSESEMYSVFCEHEQFDDLNTNAFLDTLHLLYSFSHACFLKQWKREEIRDELAHGLHLYKKRMELMEAFRAHQNNIETVWLADST
ncbi:hypothetical protein ACP2W0_06795 [Pseudobacillus badius]|uniref:hypothetical protein n=1 Tax=Bacillus badius TaxID=1455 RepID=UPI003CED3CE1